MKRRYTAIALPILICGATVAGAADAAARPIDPDQRHTRPPVAAPSQEPTIVEVPVKVPVDDTANEAVQTASGALAGAGLATAGLFLYRRRHPLAAP